MDDLQIVLFNCKGLLKGDPAAALDVIQGAQVAIFTETWLGETDVPQPMEGYQAFHFPRPVAGNRAGAPRGGVAIYLALDLADHASVWPDGRGSEGGQSSWLHIDAAAGFSEDIFLAGCYFEPTAPEDAWAEHEQQAATAAGLGWVVSAGDYNARTRNSNTHTQTDRYSADSTLNTKGSRLLRLTDSAGLAIANGTTAGATSGDYTFHGHVVNNVARQSVVDYFLLCPLLMQVATNLDVELPPYPGMDHSVLRLTLSGLRRAQLPPPAAAPCAMLQPSCRYIYTADQHQVYTERMKAAPSKAALTAVATAAADATDVASLAEAYQAFEEILTGCIREAGGQAMVARVAPSTRTARRRGVHSDPRVQALARQWRQARRQRNTEAMRQLTRHIGSLRRHLDKKQKEATQKTLLQLARDEPARFWKHFNKPDGGGSAHSPAALREYCSALLTMVAAHPEAGDGPQPAQMCADGAELNNPFAAEEVSAGIKTLKRRKAMVGSLDLDLIAPVAEEVAPALAAIFNAVARLRSMPADMALGVITMVLKKGGNASNLDEHRAITVCTLLGKLYSTCLNLRLVQWGEGAGVRAAGQTGFRPDHRTTDNVLVLRVLTERHRAEQQPLFCAFVDFRKAYDTVPRDLLWAKLKARGVHGHMLDSLKALYADVPISVKTAAGTTLPFQSTVGLKQGDPSSPNLFGLFIDDLEPAIMALGDAAALPMLDNTTMPPLLHADDLALLSTSAEGLQVQIDCLAGYAHRWGLTVSLAKTKVMVFRKDKARPPVHLKLQGQALQQVDTFRYLGVCVHAWELFGPTAAAARLDAARRSLGGMRGRCARLGLTNAKAHCSLFDTLVRPSLSYGSEIWAPGFLCGALATAGYADSEAFHRAFLRRLLGVRSSTPNMVVLAEFGRHPLVCSWARDVYSFWRRLAVLDDQRWMVKAAARDSTALAEQQAAQNVHLKNRSWAGQVLAFIQSVDLNPGPVVAQMEMPKEVLANMHQRYLAEYRASTLPKVMDYREGVRGGDTTVTGYSIQPYLVASLRCKRRAALAQLRTGSHCLRVETERHRWARLPREQRVCRVCQSGEVEDEAHMVLRCSHPQLVGLRQHFGGLFTAAAAGQTLAQFLGQKNVRGMAAFVDMAFSLVGYKELP